MAENQPLQPEPVDLGHHTGRDRILSVDSMRGIAMILVIMQHCYHLIDPNKVNPVADMALYGITRMASVAFMAISGVMISYFLYYKPDPRQVYRRFAKRALLLVLVGHPAISIFRYFYFDDRPYKLLHNMTHEYPILDTIALSLLIAPFLIRKLSGPARVAVAVGLIAVTPFVKFLWMPGSTGLDYLKEALFGDHVSGFLRPRQGNGQRRINAGVPVDDAAVAEFDP